MGWPGKEVFPTFFSQMSWFSLSLSEVRGWGKVTPRSTLVTLGLCTLRKCQGFPHCACVVCESEATSSGGVGVNKPFDMLAGEELFNVKD